MTTPRYSHTATLLPNGKVLIAGGHADDAPGIPLSTAELYDPSDGTFTPAGNMTVTRMEHTATLLSSGKVLIVGGRTSDYSFLASAELYDPYTGAFTPTGSLIQARFGHKAILLANGEVLIVPASDGSGYDAELYDPTSGTFRSTGYVFPDAAFTANLLPNGRVLFTLAPPECDWREASALIFDPITAVFSAAPNMITPRCAQTGTSLADGGVLVTGGFCVDSGTAEFYDANRTTFMRTGEMVIPRWGHSGTLLKGGGILIAGGRPCRVASLEQAEIYTPPSSTPPPVLLLSISDGRQGAILHSSTHQIVSPENPATVGEALEIYATGLIDDSIVPPQVAIGGVMAELLFFGKAPGYAALNQINVRVPSGVASGIDVPVRFNYFSRPSNEVSLAVR